MRRLRTQLGVQVLRVSLLCSLLLGCGSRPQPAKPSASTPTARVIRSVWPRFSEVRSWPPASEPFPNRGHAGAGALAVAHVSPEVRETYAHLVRDSALPDGTVVALFHREADGDPGPVYVMEKGAGTWRFLVLDSTGAELTQPDGSAAASCNGCHSDAVADSLFGIPQEPPRP